MLVLSRKVDETICIVDKTNELLATITVVSIDGSRVRIGVEAPRDIQIYRSNVVNKGPRTEA
jgi:carbon storage regulator